MLKTPSRGTRSFFVILDGFELLHVEVLHWLVFDDTGPVTFIKCTQLCNFPQHCNGNVVAFCKKDNGKWCLGVIELLSIVPSETLIIHQWDGHVSKLGVPLFVESDIKCWNDVASHFNRAVLDPKQVEIEFLNQDKGITANNAPIKSPKRSIVDGEFNV